jgi:HAE1 family hydrophobic/amphiphilic exporter-1
MTRLTRFALNNPAITYLILIALLIAGLLAAAGLKQELIPDVKFPLVTVVGVWPGASADEVTRGVVKPIEKAVDGLDNIEVVSVTSNASDSFGAVTIRAEYGTTPDELTDAVEKALKGIDLPEGAEDPEVVAFDFGDLPVIQVSARGSMGETELQRLLENEVLPEIEGIPGVGQVTTAGERENQLLIRLDPEAMREKGVTVDQIRSFLAANNLAMPAGKLTTDGKSVPLLVGNRLRSPEDVSALVLSTGGGNGGNAGAQSGAAAGGASSRPSAVPTSPSTATAATGAVAATGPAPLPAEFRTAAAALGLSVSTTADLTPDLARRAKAVDANLFDQLARQLIDSLTPAQLLTVPQATVGELTPETQALLATKLAAAQAAQASGAAPAATSAATTDRVRMVTVGAGDSLSSLAARFGSEPEAIRAANDLGSDTLTPGTLLRIPVATDGALPPAWRALGATRAQDITADMLRRALAGNPDAVGDLTEEQLLALPDATVAALPLPFVMRQSEAVRLQLMDRLTGRTGATPTPASAMAPLSGPRLAAPLPQASEIITIGDVATVERAPEDATTISRSDGKPAIGILVAKDRTANTVTVVKAIEAKLKELENDNKLLEGVEFITAFEQASFIEKSLAGVSREAILGAILAILVILFFLRSVRSTIVAAVSIPTSILIAFLMMQFFGLTLNLLTLSGLTVAIGRVVDDSIVVLENIYRHIQRGESRFDAVFNATREVSTAITSSTLVTVAVFLPLGFIGGITGQFFLPFALTVSAALLASLFVAVTIVPLLAKSLLSKDKLPEEKETAMQRAYTPMLEWALDHRPLTLVVAFGFFILSLGLLRFIPQTFLPSFGEKNLLVELQLPPGTELTDTDALSQQIEQAVADDSDIERVEATVGRGAQSFSFGGNTAGGDSAKGYLQATFKEDAKDSPEDIAQRIEKRVAEVAAGTLVTSTVSVAAAGGPSGSVYDLQVLSDDEALMKDANDRIVAALTDENKWQDEGYEDIPIENIESNLTAARPVLAVKVDPRRALEQGLTSAQVAIAVRQLFEGQDLGNVELEDDEGETETLKAVVVYPKDLVTSVGALADYQLSAPGGRQVRLGDIAEITEEPGPVQITRVDSERAALITGEVTVKDTFGAIAAARRIIDELELSDDVKVGAGVESSQQQNGFSDMLKALPISILVVYLIMVLAFGSLVQPFTILFSLPFALSGALFALAITQRPLGLSSLIGVMMLIGIVVTNAIVLVDLVQQYRERGMDVRTALVQGGRTRLRPIIMTALATIIALIPLAFGIGGGESLIAEELAVVVIGGLIVSTLLTLIVVPVIYSLLSGIGGKKATEPEDVPAVAPRSDLPTGTTEGLA